MSDLTFRRFSGVHGGWVNLSQFAEFLNKDPFKLLNDFSALSKDIDREVLWIVRNDKDENPEIETLLQQLSRNPKKVRDIFVPAYWVKAVQKAIESGYVHVEITKMVIRKDDEEDPDWLNIVHRNGLDDEYFVAVGYKS